MLAALDGGVAARVLKVKADDGAVAADYHNSIA